MARPRPLWRLNLPGRTAQRWDRHVVAPLLRRDADRCRSTDMWHQPISYMAEAAVNVGAWLDVWADWRERRGQAT